MAKKKTLISGQPTPFRTSQMLAAKAPIHATAPTASSGQGGPNLAMHVNFHGANMGSATERRDFVRTLRRELVEELRQYDRERR